MSENFLQNITAHKTKDLSWNLQYVAKIDYST